MKNKTFLFIVIGGLLLMAALLLPRIYSLYSEPVAQITNLSVKKIDAQSAADPQYRQTITATLLNSRQKGKKISFSNDYYPSAAMSEELRLHEKIFVKNIKKEKGRLTAEFSGIKRDSYVFFALALFLFFTLWIGQKVGVLSLASLIFNIALLLLLLQGYRLSKHFPLLFFIGLGCLFFAAGTLLIMFGNRKKTWVAIISTVASTFCALLIGYLAMKLTNERGMRYEEMNFITRPYHQIFLSSLLIGALGAVMDVAITIVTGVGELLEQHPEIERRKLWRSGKNIGTDIMGTMSNVLLFTYLSGSLTSLILYMQNGWAFGETLDVNLSLELIRALCGSLGIVLAIPITLFLSIQLLMKRGRA